MMQFLKSISIPLPSAKHQYVLTEMNHLQFFLNFSSYLPQVRLLWCVRRRYTGHFDPYSLILESKRIEWPSLKPSWDSDLFLLLVLWFMQGHNLYVEIRALPFDIRFFFSDDAIFEINFNSSSFSEASTCLNGNISGYLMEINSWWNSAAISILQS